MKIAGRLQQSAATIAIRSQIAPCDPMRVERNEGLVERVHPVVHDPPLET